MADKYPGISPYNYCEWEPVSIYDPDGRSGVPTKNKQTKTITITSKLYFYGSHATPELSRAIATGIASQWNGARATFMVNGEPYRVKFRIFYQTVSEEEAKRLAQSNTDPKNNFIKVEEGPKGKSSYTVGEGSNSFWFTTRDGLEKSTTPAHEYGHGLGHPRHTPADATERPDIMVPRNTEYGPFWSIKRSDGKRVINPNSRRVTQQNVRNALYEGCGSKINNVIF